MRFRRASHALLAAAVVPIAACTAVPEGAPPRSTASPRVPPLPTARGALVELSEMLRPRAAHTATTLLDGSVLVAGGFGANEGDVWAASERYVPGRRRFMPAGAMAHTRQSHSATLLPDGRVLIAGGYDRGGRVLRSAEIYHPARDAFSPTGSMTSRRAGHVAVALDDGNVLIVGGVLALGKSLASAEIFDPDTGRFTRTGAMAVARESHTATLMNDGRVLVTGGHAGQDDSLTVYASAEIYDPAGATFHTTQRLSVPRHKHDAVALSDGRVLVAGGADERDERGVYDSAEVFDPARGTWRATGRLAAARYKLQGTSFALAEGRALVVGGADRAELFDRRSGRFQPIDGSFGSAHLFAAAARTRGGVLVNGGYTSLSPPTRDAWLVRS